MSKKPSSVPLTETTSFFLLRRNHLDINSLEGENKQSLYSEEVPPIKNHFILPFHRHKLIYSYTKQINHYHYPSFLRTGKFTNIYPVLRNH